MSLCIPREQYYIPSSCCDHCALCEWCHTRHLIKDVFTLRDGPVSVRFCNADCSAKWVQYRHMIGVAHVVRMPKLLREQYLKGKTIDEFISDGMVVK